MNARTVATSMSSSSSTCDHPPALMAATRSPRRRRARDRREVDPRFDSLPACGVVTGNGYAGIREGGPYFDDLSRGQVFDWAPVATLSAGMAAAHQAIVGDRLRLALDADLCAAVTGAPG